METVFTRSQYQLYLVTGFGLSLMLSFIVVMSLFPGFTYAEQQPLEEESYTQTDLISHELTQEIEMVANSTSAPSAGKLSSVIFDSDAESHLASDRDSVRLVFGGDVDEGRWGDNPDWHIPLVDSFVNLLPLFQDVDLVLFNAEGGLCDPVNGGIELTPRGSNILWVTPDSLIDLQAVLGDTALVINQANNHSMNLGEPCMLHGITQLSDAGIGVLGAGEYLNVAREPYIIEINGTVIGFLAYADTKVIIDEWVANSNHSGVVPMDLDILREDIEALKPEVDFLIVTFHSGKEFERAVTHSQVEFALAAAQHGADLIIGHGAHVLQGILHVNDTPIYFGLGNGMMDQCFPEEYAFYAGDVRKNVWLEVEIKKSELVSTQPHVYYSAKCMVPDVASPLISDEVVHVFENIIFMDDLTLLSGLDLDGIVKDVASNDFVD